MALAQRGVCKGAGGAAGTITTNVDQTTKPQSGDLILCFIETCSVTTPPTVTGVPTGYSLAYSAVGGSGNIQTYLYTKTSAGSELATDTWTLSSSNSWVWEIVTFSGQDTSTPFADAQWSNVDTGGQTTFDCPSATVGRNSSIALAFSQNTNWAAGLTAPATWTQQGANDFNFLGISNALLASKSFNTGTTGVATFGIAAGQETNTNHKQGLTVILQPPAAASPEAGTQDFPVPPAARFASDLRTFVDSAIIPWLLGKDNIPQRLHDWPVPTGKARSNDLLSWIQFLTPRQQGGKPFNRTDWPNPSLGPRRLNDYTWVEFLTPFTQSGKPFKQDQWPVPPGPVYPASLYRAWFESLLPWTPSGQPFDQTNWPVPPGPQRASDLRTWVEFLTPWVQSGKPFNQSQWPVPPGSRWPTALLTWLQNKTQEVPPTVPPISQTDWPNPKGAQWPIELRTWLQTIVDLYPSGMPFALYDWPNPPQAAKRSVELLTFIHTFMNTPPFNQLDWQNPRTAQFPLALGTWLQSYVLEEPVLSPFSQDDWPNPRAAARSTELLTWVQSLVDIRPSGKPLHWQEFPNPLLPRYASDLRTWVENFLVPDLLVPFLQSNWPVPTSKMPMVVQGTQGFNPNLPPPPIVKPVSAQYNWPVPTAKHGVIDWIESVPLVLYAPPTPPPTPPTVIVTGGGLARRLRSWRWVNDYRATRGLNDFVKALLRIEDEKSAEPEVRAIGTAEVADPFPIEDLEDLIRAGIV